MGQVNIPSEKVNVALQVKNDPLRHLVTPFNLLKSGRFTLGQEIHVGVLKSNVIVCALPVKTVKNLITSQQTAFGPAFMPSMDENWECFFRHQEALSEIKNESTSS